MVEEVVGVVAEALEVEVVVVVAAEVVVLMSVETHHLQAIEIGADTREEEVAEEEEVDEIAEVLVVVTQAAVVEVMEDQVVDPNDGNLRIMRTIR